MKEFGSHIDNLVSKPRRAGLLVLAAASLSMAAACGFGGNSSEPEAVPTRSVNASSVSKADPLADFKGDVGLPKIEGPDICSDCAGLLDTRRVEALPIVPIAVSSSVIKPPVVGDAGLSKS